MPPAFSIFSMGVMPYINASIIMSLLQGAHVLPHLDRLYKEGELGRRKLVKILGDGELKRKLSVSAHAFSASAKAKLEKAGGKAEVVKA